jgi:hypothetical protein
LTATGQIADHARGIRSGPLAAPATWVGTQGAVLDLAEVGRCGLGKLPGQRTTQRTGSRKRTTAHALSGASIVGGTVASHPSRVECSLHPFNEEGLLRVVQYRFWTHVAFEEAFADFVPTAIPGLFVPDRHIEADRLADPNEECNDQEDEEGFPWSLPVETLLTVDWESRGPGGGGFYRIDALTLPGGSRLYMQRQEGDGSIILAGSRCPTPAHIEREFMRSLLSSNGAIFRRGIMDMSAPDSIDCPLVQSCCDSELVVRSMIENSMGGSISGAVEEPLWTAEECMGKDHDEEEEEEEVVDWEQHLLERYMRDVLKWK